MHDPMPPPGTSTKGYEGKAAAAYDYFQRVTKEMGLDGDILRAIDAGEARAPVERHVFVHPEFARKLDVPLRTGVYGTALRYIEQQTDCYEARIRALLGSVDSPIIITYPLARTHGSRLPYADADAICTPDPHGNGTVQGMLDPQGVRRLLQQLGSVRMDDRITVHGAALNACPKTFARQLLGIMMFGQYFPPCTERTPINAPERRHLETLLTMLYNVDGVRTHTRTRLGVQHNTHNIARADSLTLDLSEEGITDVYPPHPSFPSARQRPNGDA